MRSKNIIFIIILLSSVFLSTPANNIYADSTTGETFNFRKSKWGYSKKRIITAEKSPLVKNEKKDDMEILVFSDRILELDCMIIYILINDKLVRSKYIITDKSLGIWDYLPSYLKFKEALNSKYGNPVKEEAKWKNPERYKRFGNPEKARNAIDDGYVAYLYSKWKTEGTDIVLYTDNEYNDPTPTQVEYISVRLRDIEGSYNKKKVQSDL